MLCGNKHRCNNHTQLPNVRHAAAPPCRSASLVRFNNYSPSASWWEFKQTTNYLAVILSARHQVVIMILISQKITTMNNAQLMLITTHIRIHKHSLLLRCRVVLWTFDLSMCLRCEMWEVRFWRQNTQTHQSNLPMRIAKHSWNEFEMTRNWCSFSYDTWLLRGVSFRVRDLTSPHTNNNLTTHTNIGYLWGVWYYCACFCLWRNRNVVLERFATNEEEMSEWSEWDLKHTHTRENKHSNSPPFVVVR